jgi:hypothetical protein
MEPVKQSMFALYLYEDDEGNVTVRADSYGNGPNIAALGTELLHQLCYAESISGGKLLVMTPIDRSARIQ